MQEILGTDFFNHRHETRRGVVRQDSQLLGHMGNFFRAAMLQEFQHPRQICERIKPVNGKGRVLTKHKLWQIFHNTWRIDWRKAGDRKHACIAVRGFIPRGGFID